MLSREQWTKPSLEDFIAWLETKHRRETYEWYDSTRCPCGQYGESIGIEWLTCDNKPLWAMLNSLAYVEPRTFGALLSRALAFKVARDRVRR